MDNQIPYLMEGKHKIVLKIQIRSLNIRGLEFIRSFEFGDWDLSVLKD
jgi:hypothetical protein